MAKILLVDDDLAFSALLREAMADEGHSVDHLGSAETAPDLLSQTQYDMVLLDNKLPGVSGIDFLTALEEREISVPVVLITGDPTSDTAIRAMNLGAFDYVVKPLDIDELVGELAPLIAKAEEIVQSTKEHVHLPGDPAPGDGLLLLGNSRPMQHVYKLVGKVAASSVPVLILGETGTGKELFARAIHSNSPRRNRPFVALNCTALNENLLDDELFGHEPRSFSGAGEKLRKGRFEHAHGGTLFLDEIGDMPPVLQAKLLRVLENNEIVRIGGNDAIRVDVRVVSATHRDLDAGVEAGDFRQDLLFRLNGLTIQLPPLRSRGADDLKLLVDHFLAQSAARLDHAVPTLSEAALRKLLHYPWPGNIRELQHVVRRAALVCRSKQIEPGDIELKSCSPDGRNSLGAAGDVSAHIARAVKAALDLNQPNLHQTLHDMLDAEMLRAVLAECGGNQVQTARRLGLSRNGLRAKMRNLGLE